MKRRDFIQMLAATGMTASLPLTANKAFGAAPDQFLVIVNAGGGWDPTSLCDPKGDLQQYAQERPGANNGGSINSVDLNSAPQVFSGVTFLSLMEMTLTQVAQP